METADLAPEPQSPAKPEVHENTLKSIRLATHHVGKDTEAVIVIQKSGSYTMLDMQKAGAYQQSTRPVNERWREVLPKQLYKAPPTEDAALEDRFIPKHVAVAEDLGDGRGLQKVNSGPALGRPPKVKPSTHEA